MQNFKHIKNRNKGVDIKFSVTIVMSVRQLGLAEKLNDGPHSRGIRSNTNTGEN